MPAAPALPRQPTREHRSGPSARRDFVDEKKATLALAGPDVPRTPPTPAMPATPLHTPSTHGASTHGASTHSWPASAPTPAYHLPRSRRIASVLRPWIPVLAYGATSLAFVLAIAFWKNEVFSGLDALSQWLRQDAYRGYLVSFLLILLTTIPPLPLYSTLIILSGYTFGPWTGLLLSYAASLAGALLVFALSRLFLRAHIARWLASAPTVRRVVRAIERRPRVLFLIRLAPYPYNVMNCLLAAAPSLSLRTYTLCTALSLSKLIIHTSIGASIHSFAEYHVVRPGQAPQDDSALGRYSTLAGLALCVAIFVYLSIVTRAAVNDELDGEDAAEEEREAFLGPPDGGSSSFAADVEAQPEMAMARADAGSLAHPDSLLAARTDTDTDTD